jgi:hypothetical protein
MKRPPRFAPLECADLVALWIERTFTALNKKTSTRTATAKCLLCFISLALTANATDVLHLTDGTALRGSIVRYYNDSVYIKIIRTGESGTGSTIRQVPDASINFIDFGDNPAEDQIIASKDAKALRELWLSKEKLLSRPNSSAGSVALALAESLLKMDASSTNKSAHDLYQQVADDDWNKKRQAKASRGRLHALIAMGNIDEVITEATRLANESEDPELLLDARHVLAVVDFQKLEKLIDDNPKWREDDEVLEEIRNLYNKTANQFLEAYLFYGSEKEEAARGLLHAAKTHRLAQNITEAESCEDDIRKLYPTTEAHLTLQNEAK